MSMKVLYYALIATQTNKSCGVDKDNPHILQESEFDEFYCWFKNVF